MRIQLLLALLALGVLVVACGGDDATPEQTMPEPSVEAPIDEATVAEIDDLAADLEALDEELDFSELDALDEELDFG